MQYGADIDNTSVAMSTKSGINTNKISIRGGVHTQNPSSNMNKTTIRGGAGKKNQVPQLWFTSVNCVCSIGSDVIILEVYGLTQLIAKHF